MMSRPITPGEVIEYEVYRLTCLRIADELSSTTKRSKLGVSRASAEGWIAVGFRAGEAPAVVAEAYLRHELKEGYAPSPPRAPFDVLHGVWLSPEVLEAQVADLANQVRALFLAYRPCITDASGVYMRWTVKGERAVKIGCTSNLHNRMTNSGSQMPIAWLPFGGFDLEARCHEVLDSARCAAHPEGKEIFKVDAVVAVRALLAAAVVYLQREPSFLEKQTRTNQPWVNLPRASGFLRDEPPRVVSGITPVATSMHQHSVPWPVAQA